MARLPFGAGVYGKVSSHLRLTNIGTGPGIFGGVIASAIPLIFAVNNFASSRDRIGAMQRGWIGPVCKVVLETTTQTTTLAILGQSCKVMVSDTSALFQSGTVRGPSSTCFHF